MQGTTGTTGTSTDQYLQQLEQQTNQSLQDQFEIGMKTAETQKQTGMLSAALQSLQAVAQNIR